MQLMTILKKAKWPLVVWMIEKLKIVSFAMSIIGIILFLATPIFLTLWNLDTDLIGLTIAIAGVILYGILKLMGDRWKGF